MAVASHKDNLYMLKQLHVATAEVNLVDQRSSKLLIYGLASASWAYWF